MEEEPGQLTAAIGHVCLLFKDPSESKGQVFVKFTVSGRGASIILPSPPADGAGEQPVADNATSPLARSVLSEAVNIDSLSQMEEKQAAVDFSGAADTADEVQKAATKSTGGATVVDMRFSLESTKFDLTEHNIAMLETTEATIELCLSNGAGNGAETVIGTATVSVADVLKGVNTWTADLALGKYPLPESDVSPIVDDTVEGSEAGQGDGEVVEGQGSAAKDCSPGPLKFGGSTSTMRITLMTNDDTADYTVGGGSLWTDCAEITGFPEEWRVRPPPETEHSCWNDAISKMLAGTRR